MDVALKALRKSAQNSAACGTTLGMRDLDCFDAESVVYLIPMQSFQRYAYAKWPITRHSAFSTESALFDM